MAEGSIHSRIDSSMIIMIMTSTRAQDTLHCTLASKELIYTNRSHSILLLSVCSGDVDYEQTLLLLTTVEFTFNRRKRSNSGVQQQCITLSFMSDELVEDDEEFSVHLHTDDPRVRLDPVYATVIIGNNDRKSVPVFQCI